MSTFAADEFGPQSVKVTKSGIQVKMEYSKPLPIMMVVPVKSEWSNKIDCDLSTGEAIQSWTKIFANSDFLISLL